MHNICAALVQQYLFAGSGKKDPEGKEGNIIFFLSHDQGHFPSVLLPQICEDSFLLSVIDN